MSVGIIVCGGNGSGKSTLGKALARELKYEFFDIEDYYFPNNNADYKYDFPRTSEEVELLLLNDIEACNHFVLATVRGDFNNIITSMFTTAVVIEVDKEIRKQRVIERSLNKFGDRILPSGDLYEKEKRFFEMVDSRSERFVEEWLDTTDYRIIRVDGTRAIDENVERIIDAI